MLCRSILTVTLLLSLAACGPGDSASSTASPDASAASRNAGASSNPAFTEDTATAPISASDPVSSAQASLDADSHQVAPVLSYAPDPDGSARR